MAEDLIGRLDNEGKPQIVLVTTLPTLPVWVPFRELWNIVAFTEGKAHAVLVIGYKETGAMGRFLIYNNWTATRDSLLDYENGDLFNLFTPGYDSSKYVEFENYPASYFYDNTTFTSTSFPAP
ncbi:MAG: hypothetical protein EHM61_29105 [Acidobacteria bacterium]|nr:MAG: hypothetical protein EHM61_29105 [Acidobacteriota bacterium]